MIMCLAIPGKIIEINVDEPLMRTGRVSFAGVIKEVNLSYVPEANLDDYVIVHAGFAISTLDESEADQVFEYLREIGQMEESEGGDL